jgi:hypothetical protein
MASPFDRNMGYFGLPQIGTGAPSISPQESAQIQWLNAGGQAPAAAPVQANDDWDDEDWKIATMTGDPLGVKQMWEQYRGQQDEQGFMEGLGKIDWRNKDSKQKVGELLSQYPRGATSTGLNYMKIMDDLMAPEVDKFETEVAGYGAPYLQAYKTGRASGKSAQEAFAEAVTKRNTDLATAKASITKPWTDRLSDKEAAAVREAAGAARTLQDFEDEFAGVQKDNPSLTRDAYVKQFKGDASFADYKARRLMEAAGGLMQDFGLQPKEAAQILGLNIGGPQQAPSPWPTAAPTSFGTPQMVPQAAPVPAALPTVQTPPTRTTEFNFPTLGDDMAPSPTRQAIQGVKDAVGNVISNVKFDPIQSLATAVQPGGVQVMAAMPAPSTEQQNQAWTSAKQKVRDFIDKIPGDDQQKLKVLGSLLTEQPIPHDFFTKEKAKDGRIAYVPAGSALQDALRESDPKLGRFALKDKNGSREWADVARVVAQEEMAKLGLAKTPASQPTSQPSQVTTRAQYDALPSGTRYVDSNGRVAVKK